MTADIKLLPLTKYLYGREASDNERVVTVADAHAYAIRNVTHHTAAKDAEIARWREAAEWQGAMTKELLPYQDEAVAGRAEIEALKVDVEAWKASHSMLTDTCHHFQARAKRLAEALRHQRWCRTCAEDGWESCEEGRKNDALLRDQEDGK